MEELILEYLKHNHCNIDKIYDIEKNGHLVKYEYKDYLGDWKYEYLSVWDLMEYLYYKQKEE